MMNDDKMNLFLDQSYLKSPPPVKLTWQKMQKIIFLLKKLKNTESAQLWTTDRGGHLRYWCGMRNSDRQSQVKLLFNQVRTSSEIWEPRTATLASTAVPQTARNFQCHPHLCRQQFNGNHQSWALLVYFIFVNNKKWFNCTFYQIINLFLHQSYLKCPLPVKFTW